MAACGLSADERDWARSELGLVAVHEDFGALLREPQIDAVVIVSPTTLHAEQLSAALQAGKHVFVEKLLAQDVATCERVAAQAAQHPRQVAMVGFVRRFDPSYWPGLRRRGRRSHRPAFPGALTHRRHERPGRLLRALRAQLGRHVPGRHGTRHRCRTLDAHGHETATEVVGTEGSIHIGDAAARDRVQRRDAQGMRTLAPVDFFERFEPAFEREMAAFVAACAGEALQLRLTDAVEATRIGVALAKSLKSG